MKRKVAAENPHVALYALGVVESCVKNCGILIHDELATKENMEFFKDQVKIRTDPVKAKILELIQVWSHAFRNEPSYKVVQDTYNLMKMEGHSFPTLKEADAMFTAEKAPEWKEGDCCNRCRSKFGMVNRQHHCRNCGEVFCGKCSSKNSIIPKFGIEREVRVCDSCYDQINKGGPATKKEDDLPLEYLTSPLSKQSQSPPTKSEQELQEEDELALALALSQSEHENKEKERERLRKNYGIYGGGGNDQSSSNKTTTVYSQPAQVSAPMIDTSDMDPELARYLNRNYWQQKSDDQKAMVVASVTTTVPSAPVAMSESKVSGGRVVQEVYQNGAIDDDDQQQFLHALKSSVEIFVNRMKSNSQRGRSIANDSSVQSLFNVISNMHPQLMKHTHEQEELRAHFESLQDKLAQLRDAREALDALREDYREKKRREMEEQERIRQIQMAQKLEIMRQKKHEYLEMQRQLALQRLQEQEREMQFRLEQQKQLTQMRQMQNYGYHQPYGQQQMPGGPPPQGPGMMPPGGPGMPPQQVPGMPHQQVPGMPSQQTFSPETSPIHQLHQKSGGYATQSMPQQNMPNQTGVQGQQNMTSQMYATQPPSQPGYSHAGAAPYQSMTATSQPTNIPGSYTTDGGGMPGQNYQSMPYNPTTSPPNSLPSQGGPVTQGYMPQGPTDYQSFNMQGMANALPQQTQPGYSAPQQYIGGPPPPQQQHTGQQQQYQQGAPPGQMGNPQQQQQMPQQTHEAELISFD